MRRSGTPLTHEVLVEEARFILRTLGREDLFGERVRLTEAERVLDSSISLSFADYCGFLNKYGYVRIDQLANLIEVTEGGFQVAQDLDDAEFHARLSRHFARELQSPASPRALPRHEAPADPRSLRPARPVTVERAAVAMEDVLDRRYRRGEIIGSGTLGAVYRAQHVSLGRRLALKEVRSVFQLASYLRRDEIVRRLREMVETHAGLSHPNIIHIIDQNQEREFPYFVMELAEGGSLRQRLEARPDKRLELPIAIRVLTQLCYALRHAHEQGVLHLGLKPENVLFDHLGNAKLVDFGASRITERTEEGAHAAVLVGGGSVGYMAPERLQPSGEVSAPTAAADIYALGVLFYEMITGKLPGRRSPLPSQARKDVPSAFDDVFDKMTRDELDERYTKIEDVLEGLYKAFPSKEVFSPGTILLWASDPAPLPAAVSVVEDVEEVLEPELVEDAPEVVAVPAVLVESEERTGEIVVPAVERVVGTMVAPPQKRGPPPPPRK